MDGWPSQLITEEELLVMVDNPIDDGPGSEILWDAALPPPTKKRTRARTPSVRTTAACTSTRSKCHQTKGPICANTPEIQGKVGTAREKTGVDLDAERPQVIRLLSDPNFDPGPRPDRIDGTAVTPGMMFKEHPKRRREHSSAARKMDKWYNTGGIKSASDRFDNATGLGLRKRYGKIVRDGLPVLRFHEYKLLTRQGQTVTETKDGPTLFRMVPETKRRREMGSVLTVVKTQQAELQRLRRNQQVLSRQLRRAQQTVSDQGAEIERLQRELQQRRAGIATASLTQDAQDCGSN